MALKGLTFDGRIYRWSKSFSDLKNFVEDSLDLRGKWSSPGGDVKLFNSDEDSVFVIKWHGAKSGKLVIQKGNDEEYLKHKLESLISVCQSSSKILSEAEDELSRVSDVYDCVNGPVVAEVEGLKSNIISLESRIDSVVMPEISSLRAKQKDLETLIRKQDELISELKENNLSSLCQVFVLKSPCPK